MEAGQTGYSAAAGGASYLRRLHADHTGPEAIAQLLRELGEEPLALLAVFAAPQADLGAILQQLTARCPRTPIIGCSTAGEIAGGYCQDGIVIIGFPGASFRAETLLVEDLSEIGGQALVGDIIRRRARLTVQAPDWQNEFAFVLIDGLSRKEDELVSLAMAGMGQAPLFGGSAGDGTRFQSTLVAGGGRVLQNAAVIAFLRTACEIRVFSLDHLIPTDRRMVVTGADPKRRLVREINAEPAAAEYARLLGKDPAQLDPFTFAAHPVVVRFGGKHHVRAIQRVAENGDLVFFSAIDEGMVLTLADPEDMVAHLERELSDLSAHARPDAILACDCILRRIEAERKQMIGAVSDVLSRHNVVGFSTYGEQFAGLHINQTMTGVAIYPPGTVLE